MRQGVLSVLLSLKKRAVVRYQASSDLATMFAREVRPWRVQRGAGPLLLSQGRQ